MNRRKQSAARSKKRAKCQEEDPGARMFNAFYCKVAKTAKRFWKAIIDLHHAPKLS